MKLISTTTMQILFLVGACIALAGIAIFLSRLNEQRFVSSEAVILTSDLIVTTGTSGNTSTGRLWTIQTTYAFDIDGVQHEGDRYSRSAPVSSASSNAPPSDELTALKDALAPGTRVPVYYADGKPHTATLVRQKPYPPLALFLGLLMLAGGFFVRARL